MIDLNENSDSCANDSSSSNLNLREIAMEIDQEIDKNKTKIRKRVFWSIEIIFNDYEEALKSLGKKWTKLKTHPTNTGIKEYYKCAVNPKCPSKMHLHCLIDSQHVNMLRDQEEHDHNLIISPKRLRNDVKERIIYHFSIKVTAPLNIIYNLRKEGESTINYKQFYEWCKENAIFPKEDNKAFVVSYEVNTRLSRISDQNIKKELSADIYKYVDSKHRFWYEGAAISYPSTNNALESTNNNIKNKHTFRLRENVSHFLHNCINMIETWNFDRFDPIDSIKKFQEFPEVYGELWKNVDEFISLEPKIKYLKDFNLYLVATNDITEEKFGLVFDTIECEMNNCVCYYENFDFKEFVELNNNVLRVKLNMSQWEMSSCTCRDYLKDNICVHTIVVSVRKKLVKMNFCFNPIGYNKKRGPKPKSGLWNDR
ncbi:unnamed protein product [Brachionus calyciflorus]|uniref:SWIM-type domain-containing protein n=1 Tax=Brachionus calyciflorus TaxID=104777 RepID=A0A814KYV7_9BILA|nr:unnamed protein product [Brachionus calyciflorus]